MTVREQTEKAVKELIEKSNKKSGLLIVGCSTSEVAGGIIGKIRVPALAKEIYDGISGALKDTNFSLAAQCCEHLNRAVIVERDVAEKHGYEIVSVVPYPEAGGSFGTECFRRFNDAVAVEEVKADIGLDIGQTLIGMHLKRVAVPIRLSVDKIGEAIITAAATRPKFIGGVRAKYE